GSPRVLPSSPARRSSDLEFLPRALAALKDAGVTVHGDERVRAYSADVVPATEDDFYAEYLSLDIAAAVVDSLDDAIAHIRKYGSDRKSTRLNSSHVKSRM